MPFTHRAGATGTSSASQIIDVPVLDGGGVLWVTIYTRHTAATAPTPTLTAAGATFTLARSQLSSDSIRRTSVFWSQDYDPAPLAITVDHGVGIVSIIWSADEQTAAKVSGNPVTQATSNTVTGTVLAGTLAAGSGGEMLVATGMAGGAAVLGTPETGTELFELATGSTTKLHVYAAPTVDTTPSVTMSGTVTLGSLVAVEAATGPVIPASLVVARVGLSIPDQVVTLRRPTWRASGSPTSGASGILIVGGDILLGGGTLWVWVAANGSTAVSPIPTVTFPGATFTLAHSMIAANNVRLSVFYSTDYTASGSTRNLTVDFAGNVQTRAEVHVNEAGVADPTLILGTFTNTGSGPPGTLTIPSGPGYLYHMMWILDSIAFSQPSGAVKLNDLTQPAPMGSSATFWTPTPGDISQTSSGFGAGELWALLAFTIRLEEPGFIHRGYGTSGGAIVTTLNGTIPYLRGGGVLWLAAATSNTTTVTPTMSGATFTLVDSMVGASGDNVLLLWYSQDYDAASPATLTFTLASASAVAWIVDEQYPGLTSGNPIIQKAKATISGGSYTEARLAPGSGGVLYAVNYASGGLQPTTQGSGYELGEVISISPALLVETYWDPVFRQDPHVSGSLTSPLITFGLEVVEGTLVDPSLQVSRVGFSIPDAPLPSFQVSRVGLQIPNPPGGYDPGGGDAVLRPPRTTSRRLA